MVAPCRLQHVGHELGGDRSSTLILFVLASVGKIGQNGGDAASRGGTAGVDEDKELHDVVVDVAGFGGLEDEDCNRPYQPQFSSRRGVIVVGADHLRHALTLQ